MAARRVEMHRLEELVRLHRLHTPVREVARLLKMSPNTERDYREILAESGLLQGSLETLPSLEELKAAVLAARPRPVLPAQQVSGIEEWRPQVEALMSKKLRPRAMFERLREEHEDFKGSYSQVKRLWRTIRRERGPRAEDVAIPVETSVGEVAQVDFGYVGKLLDPEMGKLRKAWCFVLVLGFSRKMVARLVFDQKAETWQRVHIEAFEELGGVPSVIVPDNLKAAVLRAAFSVAGRGTELNRSYRELAKHYGFKVDPTPPYSPKKKGKVESGVKYVKQSFFQGREGSDANEVRRALARWVVGVADARIHGTTQQLPGEVFAEVEQGALLALPSRPYEVVVWRRALVHADTHAFFDSRLYSVPWRLIGREVWLRATAETVVAYADDERVASHSRRGPGRRSTIEEHLPEHRRDARHRSRPYWEERAASMGEEAAQLVREVFDSDDVLYQIRAVQQIVTHLEAYPAERIRAACRRASFYGIVTYGGVKNILVRGLDREPLPTAAPAMGSLQSPTFARNVRELLDLPVEEVTHEPH